MTLPETERRTKPCPSRANTTLPPIAKPLKERFAVGWPRDIVAKWKAAGVRMAEDRVDPGPRLLEGVTVVVTGTLPTYSRDRATEEIEACRAAGFGESTDKNAVDAGDGGDESGHVGAVERPRREVLIVGADRGGAVAGGAGVEVLALGDVELGVAQPVAHRSLVCAGVADHVLERSWDGRAARVRCALNAPATLGAVLKYREDIERVRATIQEIL